jgi:hypothetical protein
MKYFLRNFNYTCLIVIGFPPMIFSENDWESFRAGLLANIYPSLKKRNQIYFIEIF